MPGPGGDRVSPIDSVFGYRYGILVRRIPQGPGRIEYDLVEGLVLLHVHLEPLPRILGSRHIAPAGPMIPVNGIGGRDIDRNLGPAEKK